MEKHWLIKKVCSILMKNMLMSLLLCMCTVSYAQTVVEPLLKAHWCQTDPFNQMCFISDSAEEKRTAAAGCGAVAVGQILQLYKAPSHGFGLLNTQEGKIDDFGARNIDWQNILFVYKSGQFSTDEATAVANLINMVGLSMNMQYGASSSPKNSGSMMWGLQHHLHLSPTSRYLHRRNFTTKEWKDMIDQQLVAGHPVVYRGTYHNQDNNAYGHMYVIDGKNAEGLYHVCFGYPSTSYDKYVDLDYLNLSNGDDIYPGGKPIFYNCEQAMIVNCFPVDGLTDEDFEAHPLIVEQSFHLNNDSKVSALSSTTGVWEDISYKLRDCSFTGGTAFFELGAFQNGELKFLLNANRHLFDFSSGAVLNFVTKYKVPVGTPSGTYDLAMVYRHDENAGWNLCWDDAKNHMTLIVEGKSIRYEKDESYENAELELVSDIKAVSTDDEYTLFELHIRNKSCANYEGKLKLRFSSDSADDLVHTVSIYEGCSPIYRLYVHNSKLPNEDYTCSAYYEYDNDYLQLCEGYDVVVPDPSDNQYKVTFISDGLIVKEETLDYGATITAPEKPTKTGYTFTGWNPTVDATVPSHDVTYTAQFSINQYTITFDTDGGSEITAITQDYGTEIASPANPTKEGCFFFGWDKDIPAVMPADNITIKALWIPSDNPSLGDANGDGDVNIIDVNLLIGKILGSVTSGCIEENMDINKDGELNVADLNILVGLILSNSYQSL